MTHQNEENTHIFLCNNNKMVSDHLADGELRSALHHLQSHFTISCSTTLGTLKLNGQRVAYKVVSKNQNKKLARSIRRLN